MAERLSEIASNVLQGLHRRWNLFYWGYPEGDRLGNQLKNMSPEKMRIPALNATLGLGKSHWQVIPLAEMREDESLKFFNQLPDREDYTGGESPSAWRDK